MSAEVVFSVNQASTLQIADHFALCDSYFVPRLSSRVDIATYAQKIADNAIRFEAWSNGDLVGMVAAYCNDPEGHTVYITSVSVLEDWTSNGIAAKLLVQCIVHAKIVAMKVIRLQVGQDNVKARNLYTKIGFNTSNAHEQFVDMTLNLKAG